MGIPSYFSHLCRSYPHVIQRFQDLYAHNETTFDNLYLDSNSIIYDALRTIPFDEIDDDEFEYRLLETICDTIDTYIQEINPLQKVYICFDGVAPVAKLEQQRIRRFRSSFMSQIETILSSTHSTRWDKTAITPGTIFMDKLNTKLCDYYSNPDLLKRLDCSPSLTITVSTSNEAGEGEHKIFHYIRNHPHKHQKETTVIYGLDADLIVLCLNHLNYGKLYLYRETPEFVKHFSDLEPNQSYVLNIQQLSRAIIAEMIGMTPTNETNETDSILRMYDYILLTFMLGNDFLPHFPNICLRTRGMDILISTYQSLFGRGKKMNRHTLCTVKKGLQINWPTFRKFIELLAKREHDDWIEEYRIREKWERISFKVDTKDIDGNPIRVPCLDDTHELDQSQLKDTGLSHLLHLPVKHRQIEKYIRPTYIGWQRRYYETLHGFQHHPTSIQQCCLNYLQGLEWVLKYYSQQCPDWRWCYRYHYPPLLEDLYVYTPGFQQQLIQSDLYNEANHPVSPLVQLMYVLPKSSHHLLPDSIRDALHKKSNSKLLKLYPTNVEFQWAFCRYFWECHIHLPQIDINILERFIQQWK